MKILIISDAWKPQVNGVVRTYEYMIPELETLGHEVKVIGPADFPLNFGVPSYQEIKLAVMPYARLSRMIKAYAPHTIHIATEAPLGRAAARYCKRHRLPYTTAYHTHFPDYIAKRIAKILPLLAGPVKNYAIKSLRKFHATSSALFIATQSLEDELKAWKFETPMHRLTRGVKLDLFRPGDTDVYADLKRPIALYVGRIAIEKNLEAFLSIPWEGTKVLVGDGPATKELKHKYPDAVFVGTKTGEDLAAHFRGADVYVFPSKTDTFGMVLVEAMASGLPIAAYNVTGPKDIVTQRFLGILDDDLEIAVRNAVALTGDADKRHNYAKAHYTWPIVARQFMDIQSRFLCRPDTFR